MSLQYRSSDGTETPVAGLAPAGQLVPSVSLYQTGSFEVEALPAGGYTDSGVISLQTPFPDTDYIITFDFEHSSLMAGAIQKSASNFSVVIGNVDPDGSTNASTCYWKAFKLMTDAVHEADSTHIAQNTANFAPAFSEVISYAVGDYVTYNNILYRCTTAHTAGVWVAGHFAQVTVGGELNAIVPTSSVTSGSTAPITSGGVYDYLAGSPLIGQVTTTLGRLGFGAPADNFLKIEARPSAEITDNPFGTSGNCLYIKMGIVEFVVGALSADASQWTPNTGVAYRVRHGSVWQSWHILKQD